MRSLNEIMTTTTTVQEGRDTLARSSHLIERWLDESIDWSRLPSHLAAAMGFASAVGMLGGLDARHRGCRAGF